MGGVRTADNTNTAVESYLDWSDKGKASFWRYAVSAVLVTIVFQVLSAMLLVPFTILVPNYEKSLPLSVVATLVFQATGTTPLQRNPDFDLPTALLLAVIGFVGIFIQAGAEELTFRGYFTQFARRFTSSRILFLGIPALLFAAPHMANNYTGLVLVGHRGDALPSSAPYLLQVPSLPATTVVILLQAVATVIALSFLMKRAGRQPDERHGVDSPASP